MFNLLRMDLYRLKRTKAVYICFATLLFFTMLCYWLIWMAFLPEGQAFTAKIGMTLILPEDFSRHDENTLLVFRDIAMDGGGYSSILGILVALFVCLDFQSGFMKNIMALHRSRWKYICSKVMAAGIISLCCLLLQYAFCALLNLLLKQPIPSADFRNTLFYLANAWLNTTAFSALIIMICTFTRSTVAGILIALFLGSGIAVSILASLTGLFNADGWLYYTLYYNLSHAPAAYTGIADLRGILISLVFLALYSVIAAVSLTRQDI